MIWITYPIACFSSNLCTGTHSFPRKRLMIGLLLANLSFTSISKTSVGRDTKLNFCGQKEQHETMSVNKKPTPCFCFSLMKSSLLYHSSRRVRATHGSNHTDFFNTSQSWNPASSHSPCCCPECYDGFIKRTSWNPWSCFLPSAISDKECSHSVGLVWFNLMNVLHQSKNAVCLLWYLHQINCWYCFDIWPEFVITKMYS